MAKDEEIRDEILRDPINAVVELTRSLDRASREEFSRHWLLRALRIELYRYLIEDDLVDLSSKPVRLAREALTTLERSSDWVHPKLTECLLACRSVAQMEQLPFELVQREIETEQPAFPVLFNVAQSEYPFRVSNTAARTVPIIENNLANPLYCEGISRAFAHRIAILKKECGVDHLMFIEKELGPVGAISMLASMVRDTGLPACIYRETHWAERASLVGELPNNHSRIAILYDLIVTGAGICNAADVVHKNSRAHCVAAVVLCGYGERIAELHTRTGQRLRVEALAWNEDETNADAASTSRGQGEARSGSVPRQEPRGEAMHNKLGGIPAGSYTLESLPPLSANARAILDRIKTKARLRSSQAGQGPEKQERDTEGESRGIPLADEEVTGIRLK